MRTSPVVAPRRWLTVVLAALVPVLLTACSGEGSDDGGAGGRADDRLSVVATTTQTADFCRVVGGERVEVYDVVKANVDAHDYEPSPADVEALRRADLIVRNGVGLEAWLDDLVRSAESEATAVDASEGVEIRRAAGADGRAGDRAGHPDDRAGDPDDDADDGEGDPHIWHDPRNAKIMVVNIERAMSRADPGGAAEYGANREAYTAQLDRLDAEAAAEIAGLANKKLVTNHAAFGYYVARYGLEFVGAVVPSFETSTELNDRDLSRLVAEIRSRGVRAVFSEASVPPRTAAAIAKAAGVDVVAGPDALYGDSLGPPGSPGDTYLKMIRHNTGTIVDHLR